MDLMRFKFYRNLIGAEDVLDAAGNLRTNSVTGEEDHSMFASGRIKVFADAVEQSLHDVD
jgi:hypothetical protein